MNATATRRRGDHWLSLLIFTVLLNLASAVLFPMFVTDAFTPVIFIISIAPVIWGFSVLFVYRSKHERRVAWLAVAGAVYWLIPTIGMPIEFCGR
jgi:hypothetical protein